MLFFFFCSLSICNRVFILLSNVLCSQVWRNLPSKCRFSQGLILWLSTHVTHCLLGSPFHQSPCRSISWQEVEQLWWVSPFSLAHCPWEPTVDGGPSKGSATSMPECARYLAWSGEETFFYPPVTHGQSGMGMAAAITCPEMSQSNSNRVPRALLALEVSSNCWKRTRTGEAKVSQSTRATENPSQWGQEVGSWVTCGSKLLVNALWSHRTSLTKLKGKDKIIKNFKSY